MKLRSAARRIIGIAAKAGFLVITLSLVAWAQWPAGKLTNTAMTQHYCYVGGQYWGQITYYTNWTYTDSKGIAHSFSGTSYVINGSPANCPQQQGGFTQPIPDGTGSITLAVSGSYGTIGITANFFPKYHILSLLYDTPGNQSSNGFTDTTFRGTTNSVGSSFTQGQTFTFEASGGLFGIGGGSSSSVSFSQGSGTTSAFTTTFSQGQGLALNSTRNPVDHTNDTFWIWLNPLVTINQVGASAANYAIAPPSGQVMDAVRVSVAQLKTPSKIPLSILEPIVINGVTYPGLSNICAHPLPPAQCTQSNACGCVAGDFTAIVKTDPIISITGNTPPSNIDSKRYVFLNPQPSPQPFLEYGTPDTVNVGDSHQNDQTQTETTTYQTSYTNQLGSVSFVTPVDWTLKISVTGTFTWTQSVSLDHFNGSSHTMTFTLATSTPNCAEPIDVYEDYDYHTLIAVPASTPPTACDSH